MIQLYEFDTFVYSIAVLFVIFGLIAFIGILWYNTLHRGIDSRNTVSSSTSNNKSKNNVKCIPQPTVILGDVKYY